MPYADPAGHSWAHHALTDGLGVSLIVFITIYTVVFFTACAYLWYQRNHPVVRMRKISLTLTSIIILHFYLYLIFIVYPLNGLFPCGVEFWAMSLYLPVGIGLFQAHNQQLLIVSRGQNQLIHQDEPYRPLTGEGGRGIGKPSYWMFRFKLWWQGISKQGKCEGFVFAGVIVQVSPDVIESIFEAHWYQVHRHFCGLQHLPQIQ